MYIRPILCVLMMLSLSSCAAGPAMYQRTTSGKIGCPPDEIQINNITSSFWTGQRTWEADCKGTKYFCSSTATGQYSADISCAAAK